MELIFDKSRTGRKGYMLPKCDVPEKKINDYMDSKFLRTNSVRFPEVSENEVMRHYVRLSTLNHHVDKAMYPLGSCTMKYNPKINEKTSALDGFANIHPLQKEETIQGALELMYELTNSLKEICGMEAVSLQPMAGAHGELTGIYLMRKYFENKGQKRHIILIPDSAHGTNPSSAAIGGFQVVNVKSNAQGGTDLEDLKSKLTSDVAALMLTNPNTLGIFETQIGEIEKLIHENDSLLYMDGANMNALLGLVRPGDLGIDIMHYNLHKSFSTPHGGGGPGCGPIGVSKRVSKYLPHPLIEKKEKKGKPYFELINDEKNSVGKVSSFFGNFGIMVRAYTYILIHGQEGLRKNTENAIINANYILAHLRDRYELPYKNPSMHEFCLSGSRQKANGVKTLDIAKRLLDFGFHSPTIYFPLIVSEAIMIEPTETETKESLDTFIAAMLQIADEAETNPAIVQNAPTNTPMKRMDDAYAARNINVKYSFEKRNV